MAMKDAIQETVASDEQIVERVKGGETYLFEIIMRRYNQRLFRVARGILKDENEVEDVMQEAYVRAYEHLDQFGGRAKFSTWLTKIAVYEAYGRLKNRRRTSGFDDYLEELMATSDRSPRRADIRFRNAIAFRACHRFAAGRLPSRFDDARYRRHEHDRNCPVPRYY